MKLANMLVLSAFAVFASLNVVLATNSTVWDACLKCRADSTIADNKCDLIVTKNGASTVTNLNCTISNCDPAKAEAAAFQTQCGIMTAEQEADLYQPLDAKTANIYLNFTADKLAYAMAPLGDSYYWDKKSLGDIQKKYPCLKVDDIAKEYMGLGTSNFTAVTCQAWLQYARASNCDATVLPKEATSAVFMKVPEKSTGAPVIVKDTCILLSTNVTNISAAEKVDLVKDFTGKITASVYNGADGFFTTTRTPKPTTTTTTTSGATIALLGLSALAVMVGSL